MPSLPNLSNCEKNLLSRFLIMNRIIELIILMRKEARASTKIKKGKKKTNNFFFEENYKFRCELENLEVVLITCSVFCVYTFIWTAHVHRLHTTILLHTHTQTHAHQQIEIKFFPSCSFVSFIFNFFTVYTVYTKLFPCSFFMPLMLPQSVESGMFDVLYV